MNIDKASNIVKSCIAPSDLIPILKNVYIGDGRLVAFNGMQGISVTVNTGDINCVVNGDAFVKITNSIPTNKLVLSMANKNSLDIASSRAKRNGDKAKPKTRVSLVSTPIKLFKPYLFDSQVEEPLFSFKLTEDVLAGIASTSVIIIEGSANVALSGVMLDINGSSLKMYATDSVRMARYICTDNDVKVKKRGNRTQLQVLLPKKFCDLITSLSIHLIDQTVSIGATSAYVKTNEINVFTKTPQSVEFPDYETVIERFNPGNTYCPTSPRFLDAINRCLVILSNDTDGLVNLSFKDTKMKVEASSPIGEVEETVGLKSAIDIQPLQFKAELLKQAVSTTEHIAFVSAQDQQSKASKAFVGKKDNLVRILASRADGATKKKSQEEESSDEE